MISRIASSVLLAGVLSLTVLAQQPATPHTTLKVGDKAPDFSLPSTAVGQDGRGLRFKLSDFKGKKNVVLAFYVLAFTGG